MKRKAKIIEGYDRNNNSGRKFYDDRDYAEIKGLPLKDINTIWEVLSKKGFDPTETCPQCIISRYPDGLGGMVVSCEKCKYMLRHGRCGDKSVDNNWTYFINCYPHTITYEFCHPIIDELNEMEG